MGAVDPMQPVLAAGTEIAGYRVESFISRGGMAVVYRAQDRRLGRRVALKLLAPELSQDERFQQRFLRESRLAASLDHPNIIPIYEAGEANGLLYIVMRYVEGSDLKEVLDREGPLDLARTSSILRQVGAALDAAHARGLVHRDVKPGNILLAPGTGREDPDHIYLTDFGLTKRSSPLSGQTDPGHFVGTTDYVAPEQIGGKPVDARSDVYSLGCVLYQCLTGDPPFERDDEAAMLWAHLVEHPPPVSARRPGLPAGLDAVVARAMAKSPEDRYDTCRDLVTDFRAAVEGRAGSRERRPQATATASADRPARSPTPPGRPPPAGPTARRSRRTLALVAVLLLAVVAGGFLYFKGISVETDGMSLWTIAVIVGLLLVASLVALGAARRGTRRRPARRRGGDDAATRSGQAPARPPPARREARTNTREPVDWPRADAQATPAPGRAPVATAGRADPGPEDVGFCTECGRPIEREDKFCGYCGHKARLPTLLRRPRPRPTEELGQQSQPQPDDKVSFTAGYPGVVTPRTWYSLFVYVHLGRLQVQADQRIADESQWFGLHPAGSKAAAHVPLLKGTLLRVNPNVQGVMFNPAVQEVRWVEDLQQVAFRLQATSEAAGHTVLGAVEVHAGPLLVAQVPLSIHVRGAGEPPERAETAAASTGRLFSSVFASYAHEDDHVVRAFAEAYRALGIDVLVDKASLRAGQDWQQTLLRLIDEADLFQLFWSDAASQSPHVAEEWQHALLLQDRKGERFIRPLYWTSTWPPPPAQLAHLHFASLDLAALSSVAGRKRR